MTNPDLRGWLILLLFALVHPYAHGSQQQFTDGEDIGLIIMGTITNKNTRKNVALIKDTKTDKVRAVKNGFRIDRYLVTLITAKYIVLKDKSKEYYVYQNKFAGEFISSKSSTSQSYSATETYKEDGFSRVGGKIELSSALRDKLINEELSQILMQATAIPQIENGQIIGFKILQIDKGSFYDKAGLVDHDVITSINKVPLTSVAGAVKLLNSLKSADGIEFEFLRNGKSEAMSISVAH